MYIVQKHVNRYFNINNSNRKIFGVFLKQLALFNKVELINSQYRFNKLDKKDLILRKIIQVIYNIYTPNRINFGHLSSFIHNAIKFSRIDFFSILCPSYKNDGNTGIKKIIWDTTKIALHNSKILHQTLINISEWSYEINFDLYYGDCWLEQWNSQDKSERESQILMNINQINNELETLNAHYQCIRLSQINDIKNKVGFQWTTDNSALSLFPTINHKIITRNHLFYSNVLKRSEDESKKRSEHSICNYAIMWKYFTEHYKNPLMLYTASIYEKWAAYNFMNQEKFLMIIYLKKNLWSIELLYDFSKETAT